MTKQTWARPQAMIQTFAANEYVAACSPGHTEYNFKCNAGEGTTHQEWQESLFFNCSGYVDTKYVWKVKTDDGTVLTSRGLYGPCGETHTASSTDDFLHGYMDDVYTSADENIEVIIWTEGGTNVHCTTELDMTKWEKTQS